MEASKYFKIMTLKHYIIFLFWTAKMWLKGFKKETPIQVWSFEKNKFIKGYIQSLSGDSIDDKKYSFDLNVKFLEPTQGFDSRYYTFGSYSETDIKNLTLQKYGQRSRSKN